MKKTIHLVIMVMIMLGLSHVAEARKGETSSASSSKSSSYSRPSTSSSSSSKSNSAFANAAKTKQAKTAWQNFLKKDESPAPPVPTQQSMPPRQNDAINLEQQLSDLQYQLKTEKKRKKADKLAQQLATIEKQIAESRRQQQLIAVAQTAAQAMMNKQRQPVYRSNFPGGGTATSVAASNPATLTTAKPASSNSGISWGLIFVIIAGVVIVIIWLRSSNTPTTNYRL